MQEVILEEIDKKFRDYFSQIPLKKLALIKEGAPSSFITEYFTGNRPQMTTDWENAPRIWMDAVRFVHHELLSYWDDDKMDNPIAKSFADKFIRKSKDIDDVVSSAETAMKYINDVLIKAN